MIFVFVTTSASDSGQQTFGGLRGANGDEVWSLCQPVLHQSTPRIAYTGAQGLAMLDGADLVILDLGLPDIAGLDVLRAIREHKPGLPVIVLSGLLTVSEEVTALASAVLVKGQGAQRLLDAVAALLEGDKVCASKTV